MSVDTIEPNTRIELRKRFQNDTDLLANQNRPAESQFETLPNRDRIL